MWNDFFKRLGNFGLKTLEVIWGFLCGLFSDNIIWGLLGLVIVIMIIGKIWGYIILGFVIIILGIFLYSFKKDKDNQKQSKIEEKKHQEALSKIKNYALNTIDNNKEQLEKEYIKQADTYETGEIRLPLSKQLDYFSNELAFIDNYALEKEIFNKEVDNYFQYRLNNSRREEFLQPLKEEMEKYGFNIFEQQKFIEKFNEIESVFIEYKNDVLKNYNIIKTGVEGEERVKKELEMFSHSFDVLENIRLEFNNESVETDFIILSESGLYSLEVKNFGESGSYQLQITKDGQWIKILNNGDRIPMKDVVSQVNRHLAYKDLFVNQELENKYNISDVKVEFSPIIVIANDNVFIDNQSSLPIMRISQVYHYIKDKPKTIDKVMLNRVKEILENNNLPEKEYLVNNYAGHKNILTNFKEYDSQIQLILNDILLSYFEACYNDPIVKEYYFR